MAAPTTNLRHPAIIGTVLDGNEKDALHEIARGPQQMTTTQRGAYTAREGDVIYNTTTHKLNVYTGSAWEAVTSV